MERPLPPFPTGSGTEPDRLVGRERTGDERLTLRLSVLDQAPISVGSTSAEALHNSLDLAGLSDDLGYHRYWVAEHHGTPMLASASPEALIGPRAAPDRGSPATVREGLEAVAREYQAEEVMIVRSRTSTRRAGARMS